MTSLMEILNKRKKEKSETLSAAKKEYSKLLWQHIDKADLPEAIAERLLTIAEIVGMNPEQIESDFALVKRASELKPIAEQLEKRKADWRTVTAKLADVEKSCQQRITEARQECDKTAASRNAAADAIVELAKIRQEHPAIFMA